MQCSKIKNVNEWQFISSYRPALYFHRFRPESSSPHSDMCQNRWAQRHGFLTSCILCNRWRLMWSRIYRRLSRCLKVRKMRKNRQSAAAIL